MIKNFLAAIGITGIVFALASCAIIFMVIGGIAKEINAAPVILEQGLATIQATGLDDGVRFTETAVFEPPTPQPIIIEIMATAVPLPTYTPPPAYTPLPTQPPVKLIDNRGLPSMGPYSLDQVQQCQAIITNGHIDTLPSPQRELCQQYVNVQK